MKLLFFLLRSSKKIVGLIVIAGLVGGAFSTGLIALINAALSRLDSLSTSFVMSFAGLVIARPLLNAAVQILIVRFSQKTIADLRMNLSRKILSTPLRRLEVAGNSNLTAVLIHDIQAITNGLVNIPSLAVNVAIVLGCSAYLAWLSWQVFVILLSFIALGFICYRFLVSRAFRVFKHARDKEDKMFRYFHAVLGGIKELKLHYHRREALLSENLQPTVDSVRRHSIAAWDRFILANNWTQFLFYALIGVILFVIPGIKTIDTYIVTGYVLGTLYLIRPLEVIMDMLPHFGRTMAALKKAEELDLSLSSISTNMGLNGAQEERKAWKCLELVDVNYIYRVEQDDRSFGLGPIDMKFRAGELVFVTGGNGSGKSTLAKLVTGLYPPDEGQILIDGEPVTSENRDQYRQLFSAVFSDFYLFDSLLGLCLPDLDARAKAYLAKLELERKVEIKDGIFSTTGLSQGQRKRMALLTSYMEDRPIYVFDEWAADQDPEFKAFFYETLLPELKARNKCVLVITHDDRFFYLADRVVRLEHGKLVKAA